MEVEFMPSRFKSKIIRMWYQI